MTEDEFTAWTQRDGFEPVTTVEYQPDSRPDLHDHEFDARVLIVRGELTMAYETDSVVLGPGDECEVPAGTVHAEHGSSTGAAGLLAIRPAGA